MSAFFASQQPVDAPRRKPRAPLSPIIKQKADRFESLSHEHLPGEYLPVPPPATVRLVSTSPSPYPSPSPSPSPESTPSSRPTNTNTNTTKNEDGNGRKAIFAAHGPRRPQSALLVKDTTSVSPLGISGGHVSEIPVWTTHHPQMVDYPDHPSTLTLVANDSGHELPKLAFDRDGHVDGDQWTLSSPAYSRSSTLNESELAQRKTSDRLSSLGASSTTSPRTFTPVEVDRQDLDIARSGPVHALHTLDESSPEGLSTVREVPLSDSSSTHRPDSGPSDTTSGATQIVHRKSLKRAYSAGSLRRSPSIANLREVSTSPTTHDSVRYQPNWTAISSDPPTSSPNFVSYNADHSSSPTRQGPAIHTADSIESISDASSPNFLAYASDSNPSTSGELNNAESIDSLNSHLHRGQHTLNPSSSWASLDEDHDTLPPLNIPKKRTNITSAPVFDHSAFAGLGPSYVGEEMDDEIDTLPYPKRPFSSHLSTIASESDRHSRSASRHMSHFSRLSHFSLGSGVLTGDEESFIAPSPTIAERRRMSLPTDSLISAAPSSTFDEYTGEMSAFREASAVPQPLFRAGQPTMLLNTKKYHGPLPPLPPIPMSQSNEDIDTLSALPSPSLKTSKSSRSLKHARSKSTPSHSRHPSQISTAEESLRYSAGSSIFPTWAKQYYTGNAVLQSKMSLASLNGQQPSRTNAKGHMRNESAWTERSITSRLGTGYSYMESGSPVSSHFLPSIFRPRTWTQQRPRSPQKSTKSGKSGRSMRSKFSGRSRPESSHQRGAGNVDDDMVILPNPLTHHPTSSNDEILPSGQPKYGRLKDAAPSPRPPLKNEKNLKRLPRKYSKQKLWDQMEFPRPMTKDRMSDAQSFSGEQPHLGRPMRASQRGTKVYETPSFVESLDCLVKERGGRQILFFMLGFVMPLFWMVGAVLPLPERPVGRVGDPEKGVEEGRTEVVLVGDAERYREERNWAKARWWRMLNRVMSLVGLGVVGAIIALVVVATR